jgi:hypothetical protein
LEHERRVCEGIFGATLPTWCRVVLKVGSSLLVDGAGELGDCNARARAQARGIVYAGGMTTSVRVGAARRQPA